MDVKTITEIAGNVSATLAVLGAAGWFLYATQFKPRLQFDIDCHFVPLTHSPERLLVEIQFIFENKGFVEHKLWNLNVSVHTLDTTEPAKAKDTTKETKFPIRLLPKTQLVASHYGYYFVRPGVRQVITHIMDIPANLTVIRVTSSFDYHRYDQYPHTIRRIFKVQNDSDAA